MILPRREFSYDPDDLRELYRWGRYHGIKGYRNRMTFAALFAALLRDAQITCQHTHQHEEESK